MKSRSEVLAEKKKKSAADRTVSMFDKDEEKSEVKRTTPKTGMTVTCGACEEEMPLDKLDKREDGSYECMHCAAPIKVGKGVVKKSEPEEPKSEKKSKSEETSEEEAPKNESRSGSFCGDCGAEWPRIKGRTEVSCGHMRALRVDDPRKAKNMKEVTSSGVANTPPGPPSVFTPPVQGQPSVTVHGNRISIGWGKCTFPVGEAVGMKYANMEIPTQIITVDLPEGADRVSAARDILAELQKIADVAFDTQFKWYCDKLKLLDK